MARDWGEPAAMRRGIERPDGVADLPVSSAAAAPADPDAMARAIDSGAMARAIDPDTTAHAIGADALTLRPATPADHAALWAMLAPVIRAGETYALPRDMAAAGALAYWCGADRSTFIAEQHGAAVGTYYLRANQLGGGAHVANCGYVSAAHAGGRGIARHMAEHSFIEARARGFTAMQFNFVVGSNSRALRLWQRLGFATVGRVPGAFMHPRLGAVDAYVMHRAL